MGAWSVTVVLDAVDISAQLTGVMRIDAEEGAARTAEFAVVLDPGTYQPADWIGKSVTIAYTTDWAGSGTRFTGQVDLPILDARQRTLTLRCTDGLQVAVEASDRAALDTLIGGYWSGDIFDPEADLWTYAQNQVETVPASLELSPVGMLRLSGWDAALTPDYVFTAGDVIDETPRFQLADWAGLVNQIDITFRYRWMLLRHRERDYGWGGAGDFCTWFGDTHELPSQDMVRGVAESTGTILSIDLSAVLIPTDPEPCPIGSPGVAWVNNGKNDLLISANWTAARRTSQVVTETYYLRVANAQSIADHGLLPATASAVAQTDYDAGEWERNPATPRPPSAVQDALGDWVLEQHDRTQMQAAMDAVLNREYVRIRAAHRRHRVEFDVPLDPRLDLIHTVQMQANGIDATGKIAQLSDEVDFGAGSAITTVRVAVSTGDGASTLSGAPPSPPAITYGHTPPATLVTLSTQIGGRTASPAYDDGLDGFSGNYSVNDNVNLYPRRVAATGQEIEEEARDPIELEQPASPAWHSFAAGVPDDALSIML